MIDPLNLSPLLLAHVEGAAAPQTWAELATDWSFDPLVCVGLALSAWIYRRGSRALRARVSEGRGLRRWERASFWAGWWTLLIALISPLHPWGRALFTAHMTQHELLMLVAAPLLVLGRPVVALLMALPRDEARALGSYAREPWFRAVWVRVSHPLAAWLIHAVALWSWHVPALYEATLRQEWIHHMQHVCFFGSALLFWWALFHARPDWRGVGVATLYLFTTMMHSGLLGALILFARTLIYPSYAQSTGAWSLTPLEDQQLGGLIMWIPGGMVYVIAALVLMAGWLRRSERTVSLADVGPALAQARGFVLVCLLVLGTTGCADTTRWDEAAARTGGDPMAGRQKIREAGCGTCHVIPGVAGARGQVGPPLTDIASRRYLAGSLPNDTENLIRWILDPHAHDPRTAMPRTVTQEADARDIAAYLATLRD